MSSRAQRDMLELFRKYSVTVIDCRQARHRVYRLRTPDGREIKLTTSVSASDQRAMKNCETVLKKLLKSPEETGGGHG